MLTGLPSAAPPATPTPDHYNHQAVTRLLLLPHAPLPPALTPSQPESRSDSGSSKLNLCAKPSSVKSHRMIIGRYCVCLVDLCRVSGVSLRSLLVSSALFQPNSRPGARGGVQARVSITDTPPDSCVARLRSLDGHSRMKKSAQSVKATRRAWYCVHRARSPTRTEERLSRFALGYFCALFKCPNCNKMWLFVGEVDFNDLLRK